MLKSQLHIGNTQSYFAKNPVYTTKILQLSKKGIEWIFLQLVFSVLFTAALCINKNFRA